MTTSAELVSLSWPVAPFLFVRFWAAVTGRRPRAVLEGALALGVLAVGTGLERAAIPGALQVLLLAVIVFVARRLDRRTGGAGGLWVGALWVATALPVVLLRAFELLRLAGLRGLVTGLPDVDLVAACVLAVLVPVAVRGPSSTPLWRGWTPTAGDRRAMALCAATLLFVGLWPLLVRVPLHAVVASALNDLGQLLIARDSVWNGVWFPLVRSLGELATVAGSLLLGWRLSGGEGRRPLTRADRLWLGLPAGWLVFRITIDLAGYYGVL